MLSHFGVLILFFVWPLVVRLTVGKRDEFVRQHATEALNGQITFGIVWNGFALAAWAMSSATGDHAWLGMLAGMGLAFVWIAVCSILGAIKAWRGERWRYPASIPFVRGAMRRHAGQPS